jgi:uncharacterized protein YndB with AHSA1/START domain/DNA-binding transcriptional ArsR family regulator
MKRDVFGAIADPTRREILHQISGRALNVQSVADHFELSRTAIYKHLKILKECVLVVIRSQGRERYCQARLEKLHEVADWIAQYRQYWNTRLDALETYLIELQTKSDYTMEAQNQMPQAQSRDVVITRLFNAPLEQVWKAWTDPEHFKRWWGPKNFSSPVCKMDLREGGKYLFSMQSPEGQVYYSTGEYRKVAPMELLEFTDSFSDAEGNEVPASEYGMDDAFPNNTIIQIAFKALGNQTQMTLTHIGLPVGEATDMTQSGWNESFDKLADSL